MSTHGGHAKVPHAVDVHVPWRAPHHPPSEKPMVDGLDLANPLHSGYMFKEAHSHLVFHKRFFVLFPQVLVYYEKESDYKKDLARGSLEHRHRAIGLEGVFLSKPEKKVKGARFCFILHAPDQRNERHDFFMVTETREDRKTWIQLIQDQNPALLDSKHHQHIAPDTPHGSRRGSAVQPENTTQEHTSPTSSLVTTSIRSLSMDDHHNNGHYPERPGSPRHDIHRLGSHTSSTTSCMDYLDIQHLDIREGPSDTEDSSTNH